MSHDLSCYRPGGHSHGQGAYHVRVLLPLLDALRVRHGLEALDQALRPSGHSYQELQDLELWLGPAACEQILLACQKLCGGEAGFVAVCRGLGPSPSGPLHTVFVSGSVVEAFEGMIVLQDKVFRGSEHSFGAKEKGYLEVVFTAAFQEPPIFRVFRLARFQGIAAASGGRFEDVKELSYRCDPDGTELRYGIRLRRAHLWYPMLAGALLGGLVAMGLHALKAGKEPSLRFLIDASAMLFAGATAGLAWAALRSRHKEQRRSAELDGVVHWLATATKESSEKREMEHVYRRVVRQSQEGILTLGPDGLVDFANPKVAELLGVEAPKLHGRRAADLFAADLEPALSALWDEVNQPSHLELNASLRPAEGMERPVRLRLSPIRSENGSMEAVLVLVADRLEMATARRAIAQSDRLLEALVDLGQDAALLLDGQRTIRFATQNIERLFQLQPAMLEGQALDKLIHPDDLASFVELLAGLKARARVTVQVRLREGQGGWRWVEATANQQLDDPYLSAIVVHLRDITEKLEAEAAIRETEDSLRRSEQHFRMLIESTSDMVVVLDEQTRPLYINPATTILLGYSLNEVRQLSALDLVSPAERDQARAAIEQAAGGATVSAKLNIRHKDGRYILLESRGRFTKDPEGRTVFVMACHDITHQTAMEEREHQENKMEAIGRLAGGVAHDFNNLLTVIQGNAELAMSLVPKGAPLLEMLTEIGSAAERAGDLTNQLLAFGRKKMLKPQVLEVNKVINDNIGFLKRILGADIRVNTVFKPDSGWVEMDSSQLTQVILNLVANARDAMPHGGVLSISTSQVEITPVQVLEHADWAPGRFVRLTVQDSGVGMDPAVLSRIFEPYFTTRGKGTGLGLATVFGIVKQGGGFLWVQSDPGVGSTFHVHLPSVASTGMKDLQTQAGPTLPVAADSLVLVVDDEHNVRRIAVMALAGAGYRVIEAASGEEALALWRESRFHGKNIALVLSDVIMPRMTGLQLAEQLNEEDPDQRILLMSGFNEAVLEDREGLAMPWTLLHKPFKIDQLLQSVRTALQQEPKLAD